MIKTKFYLGLYPLLIFVSIALGFSFKAKKAGDILKPNIIFILTDDQRWDALGVAGNSIIKTPQMDELAKKGVYFKNAFSTTPICAASRASILTGLYERTHNYTFQKPSLQVQYTNLMYPKILKENGYHVGFYGKLGVAIDRPEQYFDESDFYDRGPRSDKGGYFYKKLGFEVAYEEDIEIGNGYLMEDYKMEKKL